MIFNTVESFRNKSCFYSDCDKFWIVQNYFPIVTKLNKIDVKKKAKSIATFDFSNLFTTILHKLLIKVLPEVINFVSKSKVKKRIGLRSKIDIKTSTYWTSKGAGRKYFAKQTLVSTMSFLISKCFFTIGDLFLKKILVYQWVLIQHHFGSNSSFIFF